MSHSFDAQPLQVLLEKGLQDQISSAISAGIYQAEKGQWVLSLGKTCNGSFGKEITDHTFFDLASLTKVLATATILARLVDQKKISLDGSLKQPLEHLPWHSSWQEIYVHDVLSHQAGFSAWKDLAEASGGKSQPKKMLCEIAKTPPEYPRKTKTIYSDLGFILLGEWLAHKTHVSFSDLIEKEVKEPLSISELIWNPLEHGIAKENIVATEELKERGGVVQGEVHDKNAFFFGGLAGHTGLFGTVQACLAVGGAWLKSYMGKSDFLSHKTVMEFVKPVKAKDGSQRALGWDLPSLENSSAGKNISQKAIGHLGYTGTSIWIDLERKTIAVLLTNRVHPTAENKKHILFRRDFFSEVWKVMDR